jgi:hypothetical protein
MATKRLTVDPIPLLITSFMIKTPKKQKELWLSMRRPMKVSSFMRQIVFVNGSTLGSTFILLNSTSEAHLTGNASGPISHNLMDLLILRFVENRVGFNIKHILKRK